MRLRSSTPTDSQAPFRSGGSRIKRILFQTAFLFALSAVPAQLFVPGITAPSAGVTLLDGAFTATLAAQDMADMHEAAQEMGLPTGWMAHFDSGHGAQAAESLEFVVMEPGWHVTTGPSGIFYQHDFRAEGDFTVSSEIHLFDPGERRESFGIFVGGSELHGDQAAYTYFLVRRTGEFMIRHRAGEELHDVQDWTAHDAVRAWDDRDDGAMSVPNTLAIRAAGNEVVFLVNETEVHRVPRPDLPVEGHYGLRINHNLNLHVTAVELQPGN